VTDEKSYIETQVDIWAKEENLSGIDKEIFAVKFNDYYKKFKGDTDARSKLNTLFQMYKSKKVDFDKLEIYATAFDKNASIANIKSLDNFQQAQKLSKEQLQQLTDALTGNNSRQKAVVEAVLKSGRLPYNSEEATSLKLFKMLEDVKEKSGEDKLLLEHYAVLAGIDDGAKKTAFIQKLSEWSVNKKIEVPKLRFLGDFYKAGMKFDELEVLVDGAKANIDVKDLKVIAAYAIKEKINKTDLAKYSAILAGTNANAKRILIDSIKLNRIPITGEELTQTKLEQVLDKVKTEAGFFDLQIDQWVKNLDTTKRTVIKEKLTKYKNDLKLTIPQLGNLVSLNSTYPFQRLDDMDAYADALKKQVKFGQLNAVADFLIRKNTTINATTRTEKTNQYLSILSSSDPTKNNQKQILQNAISRGMISLTGKEATIANIDEALTASNNEQSLTEFSLKQIAKDKGLREGGVKYEEFMRKYYTDLYQGRKLKIGEIRFIISIDSKGIFGDSNLTNLVKLMKSQDGTGLVSRLERFATSEGLTRTKVSEYLAILSGSPSPKRDMLIQALNSKFVPISNTRLY
ncbi:MAG: hypothetical protein LW817_06545, partial [Candidatus Caenarcaniphilales bacterium]|nr:hypothetical protein [Candidatus Caenarcaniphilales bacterium]